MIREPEAVSETRGGPIIIHLFNKGNRSSCEKHKGINLAPAVIKLFAAKLLRWLTVARESQRRKEWVGKTERKAGEKMMEEM